MDITIDTNMPIIYPKTAILGDRFIKTAIHNLKVSDKDEIQKRYIRQMGVCNICKNKYRAALQGENYICPTYLSYRDSEIEIPEDDCPDFESF